MGETTPIVRVVGRYVDGLSVSVYGEPRLEVFEYPFWRRIAAPMLCSRSMFDFSDKDHFSRSP